MGDPYERRTARVNRLRQQLKKKQESLADEFAFKIYLTFHFKDKKKSALFEMTEIIPVMTNNFEDNILSAAKSDYYTYESGRDLLDRDIVQLHAPRWRPLRTDLNADPADIDFFLWPRADIEHIECAIYSRWKIDDDQPFRPLLSKYNFDYEQYHPQLLHLQDDKADNGMIITNDEQSVFLFVNKQRIQTPKKTTTIFKLSSVCLYVPQDRLTHWGIGTCSEMIQEHFLGSG